MHRVHFNPGPGIAVFRTWQLNQNEVTEADFKWLKGLGIPIRIDQPTHKFEVYGGYQHTHQVAGKPIFTLDTRNDKQRDMLVLKYGNDVTLIEEQTVAPSSLLSSWKPNEI